MTSFAPLALLFFLLPMVGRFCPCRSWRRQGGDRREKNGTKASKRAGDKSALFCLGSYVKAPGSVLCAVAPMHITDLLYVTQWCIRAAMGRGGFRLDCFWESTDIGPPEGRPGSGFVFFLPKCGPISGPAGPLRSTEYTGYLNAVLPECVWPEFRAGKQRHRPSQGLAGGPSRLSR